VPCHEATRAVLAGRRGVYSAASRVLNVESYDEYPRKGCSPPVEVRAEGARPLTSHCLSSASAFVSNRRAAPLYPVKSPHSHTATLRRRYVTGRLSLPPSVVLQNRTTSPMVTPHTAYPVYAKNPSSPSSVVAAEEATLVSGAANGGGGGAPKASSAGPEIPISSASVTPHEPLRPPATVLAAAAVDGETPVRTATAAAACAGGRAAESDEEGNGAVRGGGGGGPARHELRRSLPDDDDDEGGGVDGYEVCTYAGSEQLCYTL